MPACCSAARLVPDYGFSPFTTVTADGSAWQPLEERAALLRNPATASQAAQQFLSDSALPSHIISTAFARLQSLQRLPAAVMVELCQRTRMAEDDDAELLGELYSARARQQRRQQEEQQWRQQDEQRRRQKAYAQSSNGVRINHNCNSRSNFSSRQQQRQSTQ